MALSSGPWGVEGISWSSAGVLRQTLGRAKQAGLRVAALPTMFDIDTVSELRKLAMHIADGS